MEFSLLWLGTLLSAFIRWTVSLYPYSGQGKPPMYGDLEGFRHWMEIATNLPVEEWYVNSTRNDLQYWGFDYPPLAAYHSYINGHIAKSFNPSWVAFGRSRGYEGYFFKLFMRYSVVVVDLLIFYPAVIFYFYKSNYKERVKACAAAATLLYPGLILIDHGHFQFNCISLGFFIWALAGFRSRHDVLGSIAFCLALNYKQMELYHSVPIFFYLVGTCIHQRDKSIGFLKFLKLGIIVLIIFAICWLPFIHDVDLAFQVVHRLFPFARGLYEDKVANVWCSLSVFIKLKDMFSTLALLRFSAITTLACLLPLSWNVLHNPSYKRLQLALVNSSLIFFLFSFQVHEKSILLASLVICLILSEYPLPALWFLLISVFSLLPLLIKDQLVIPYFATLVIYLFIVTRAFIHKDLRQMKVTPRVPVRYIFFASGFGALILSIAAVFVPPPARYPDLHAVLCSLYSCGHFVFFTAYFHWLQFKMEDAGGSGTTVYHKIQYTKLKNN